MSWTNIIIGWRNHIIPPEELKEVIKQVAEERLAICEECPMHSKYLKNTIRPDAHCTICSCTLVIKTKVLSEQCPQGKWKSIDINNFIPNLNGKEK